MSDRDKDNYDIAVEIASLPQKIRGFGHIKEANRIRAERQKDKLQDRFYRRDDKVIRIYPDRVA